MGQSLGLAEMYFHWQACMTHARLYDRCPTDTPSCVSRPLWPTRSSDDRREGSRIGRHPKEAHTDTATEAPDPL